MGNASENIQHLGVQRMERQSLIFGTFVHNCSIIPGEENLSKTTFFLGGDDKTFHGHLKKETLVEAQQITEQFTDTRQRPKSRTFVHKFSVRGGIFQGHHR
jgi:hypothetical protein